MTISYQINPDAGWPDQVGLRLECSGEEARAIHRALRALFRGRMSPVFDEPSGLFTILVPAQQLDLEQQWAQVLIMAGLDRPAPTMPRVLPATAPQAIAASSRVASQQLSGVPGTRGASETNDWERRFRNAIKTVLESERDPVVQSTVPITKVDTQNQDKELDGFLEALPVSSRLRAAIARYAQRKQFEPIVALCQQRRQDVLALPTSALLVSQLLDAHQAEAARLESTDIAKAGREIALAFLPELERLRQGDMIRARIRSSDTLNQSQDNTLQETLQEQLTALIAIEPAERLSQLQQLHSRYPQAIAVCIALAAAHEMLGHIQQALNLYRSVERTDNVLEHIMTLLLTDGQTEQALRELEGQQIGSDRLRGLQGAALAAVGRTQMAYALLKQAWDSGERLPIITLAYARVLATSGNLEHAAEPYQIALETSPDALAAEDYRAMYAIAQGAGYGLLSPAEEAVYLERYLQHAGRKLQHTADGSGLLEQRVKLYAESQSADHLDEALADWLECLAEQEDETGLEGAATMLRDFRRKDRLSGQKHFEILEGLEPLTRQGDALSDLLALEYQAIAIDELTAALRKVQPMPLYIHDLRRALHFLNRDFADQLAQIMTDELRALNERNLSVPSQLIEESTAFNLSEVKLTLVGGHVATRREVERELREHYGLLEYQEIAPSDEEHFDKAKVRERVLGRHLITVITRYTGHDLTNIVRDLQRTGDITGTIIWPTCRGKSGVVREILKAIANKD